MKRARIAGTILFAGLASLAAPVAAQQPPSKPPASCAVGLATSDRRALAWSDYEFGQTEGLPMALQARGCYSEAAAASRDYLAFGPLLTTRQQAITTLHMGRNLALAGREAEAAVAIAASRRSDQAADGLDWNRYVQGVYAFLVKDAATLDAAVTTLGASPSEGDRTNAANLRQLQLCFTRSYLAAMNEAACMVPGDVAAH